MALECYQLLLCDRRTRAKDARGEYKQGLGSHNFQELKLVCLKRETGKRIRRRIATPHHENGHRPVVGI